MKLIIDYNNVEPDENLVFMMEAFKCCVEERLASLQPLIAVSSGILLIHTDGTFELKGMPYQLGRQLIALLGPAVES